MLRSLLILSSIFLFSFSIQEKKLFSFPDRNKIPDECYEALRPYPLILLGENHGTKEIPEIVEGLANLFLLHHEKVIIGLEISKSCQDTINLFLKSGDEVLLKNLSHFTRSFKDGRSSIAMSELLKYFVKNEQVKIICYDQENGSNVKDRDSMMAVNILEAIVANKDFRMITLSGNVHNRRNKFEKRDGTFSNTMGFMLDKIPHSKIKKKDFLSLDIVYRTGTAWNCNPACGIHPCGNEAGDWAAEATDENFIAITGFSEPEDYDGVVYIRQVSFSRPLVE